jgi:hypothetical protein
MRDVLVRRIEKGEELLASYIDSWEVSLAHHTTRQVNMIVLGSLDKKEGRRRRLLFKKWHPLSRFYEPSIYTYKCFWFYY